MAQILWHFDWTEQVVVKSDALDFVSATELSQCDSEGTLHPVGLYVRKHSPAKANYNIDDKERLAIVRGLAEWIPEHVFGAVENLIQILSHYQNL